MNTPTIQNIVDQGLPKGLLRAPAFDQKRFEHAFEELVLTRAAEYRGEVPEGSTSKLAEEYGISAE